MACRSVSPIPYSHALDEQSALGLFYNGNNPNNLRDGYASADFDRTHVINFNYLYQFPKLINEQWMNIVNGVAARLVNGWAIQGLTVLQSGQPYSIIDYSGAVGSIYLRCRRRHHKSNRSFGPWMHTAEREDGRVRRIHSRRWSAGAEGLMLYASNSSAGRAERGYSVE